MHWLSRETEKGEEGGEAAGGRRNGYLGDCGRGGGSNLAAMRESWSKRQRPNALQLIIPHRALLSFNRPNNSRLMSDNDMTKTA